MELMGGTFPPEKKWKRCKNCVEINGGYFLHLFQDYLAHPNIEEYILSESNRTA